MDDKSSTNDKDVGNPSSAKDARLQHSDDDEVAHRKTISRNLSATHRHDKKKHSKMPSSSSLHSLVPILKQYDKTQIHLQSTPNVSFEDDFDNENNKKFQSSTNVSCDNSTSHLQYTIEGDESLKAIPNGSISTQTSTGFSASFFSILEKIGLWRSQDLHKTTPTSTNETKYGTSERRTARNSVSSLLYRTLNGGN